MIEFIKSASSKSSWIIDGKTEFCLIGRSNVGKSTLLNALAKNKIAITSKTPGRTRLINFFNFDKFRLVDLPGYGFAKLSGERHDEMIRMSEEYLEERENLQGVFQICDINVITKDDILMSKYFNDTFNNYFIILNKIDSIKPSELEKMVTLAANKLNVTKDKLILVSAKSSTNVSQVYMTMTKLARERN